MKIVRSLRLFLGTFTQNYYFLWDWNLNSGFHVARQAVCHLNHISSIFLLLFWRQSLTNYLQGLALNHDSFDLSLPSS
jgi:hypothetical protein